jgi:hypothetical protein
MCPVRHGPEAEFQRTADLLLKDLRSADPATAARAAARFAAARVLDAASAEDVLGVLDRVRHRHALDAVATEAGHASWAALKRAGFEPRAKGNDSVAGLTEQDAGMAAEVLRTYLQRRDLPVPANLTSMLDLSTGAYDLDTNGSRYIVWASEAALRAYLVEWIEDMVSMGELHQRDLHLRDKTAEELDLQAAMSAKGYEAADRVTVDDWELFVVEQP